MVAKNLTKKRAITNVMETVVAETLDHQLDDLNMACTCEQCLADVMAIALNQLPAKYIANPSLEPLVRVVHEAGHQQATTILSAVSYAAKIVSDKPNCTVSPNATLEML